LELEPVGGAFGGLGCGRGLFEPGSDGLAGGRLGGLEVAERCSEGTGFTGFQTPGTGVGFNLETRGGVTGYGSGEEFGDDFAVDVGEAEVAALEAVGEAGVIEAEEMEEGGVEVVDADGVAGGATVSIRRQR
jgi:hypothetical protein